jgi:hypothetical protein
LTLVTLKQQVVAEAAPGGAARGPRMEEPGSEPEEPILSSGPEPLGPIMVRGVLGLRPPAEAVDPLRHWLEAALRCERAGESGPAGKTSFRVLE